MGAIRKIPETNVMTEERLRAHWFSGPQVPFWNYDPAQLTIGLEVEYFIAKVDGANFTLATKQQYLDVITDLCAQSGYQDRQLKDQPGRISKDTKSGFIAIKPDFAWHILEISLPPRASLDELRCLINDVVTEIDVSLRKYGLCRLDISCLPNPPQKIELVELDRMESFTKSVHQRTHSNPFVDPLFPAYLTATHVHLNAFNESAIQLWPSLFNIESHVGEVFCRAKSFGGRTVASVRTEFLNQTMGAEYKLKGIPERIPQSVSDYVELLNSSTPAFPKDRFFPVRDVAYVRPSRYGTIEFRSACSAKTAQDLVEIAFWRIVQLYAAVIHNRDKMPIDQALTTAIARLPHAAPAMITEMSSEKLRTLGRRLP